MQSFEITISFSFKVIIPMNLGPKINYGTWHSAINMFHNSGEIEVSECEIFYCHSNNGHILRHRVISLECK